MIRLHPVYLRIGINGVTETPEPSMFDSKEPTWRVSSRRIPRGYIRRVRGIATVRTSSWYEATLDYRPCVCWMVIGLKGQGAIGFRGYKTFETREAAIHALLSHVEFHR